MVAITENEFRLIADYVKENYGINLKDEKKTLVNGRLNNVLDQLGFENFTDYFNHISKHKKGDAAITFVDKITTNHTFFMRESDHFFYLRDTVLPYLSKVVKDKDLRIWSAACSSGEEPYTLAMIIDDFFGKQKVLWDTKVLATDISQHVLQIAKEGVYSKERISPLPAHWKSNYFRKYNEDELIINDKIKNEVIFRKFNLMDKSFPFKKKFHVIFCRNVMIYFDTETKNNLAKKFYDLLEYGGYLFIGHSETINREITGFKYIMPAVYRKI